MGLITVMPNPQIHFEKWEIFEMNVELMKILKNVFQFPVFFP